MPSNSVFENVFPMNDEANNKRIRLRELLLVGHKIGGKNKRFKRDGICCNSSMRCLLQKYIICNDKLASY